MARNNSINNESIGLTIDPGASGDSFVQFDINGTGEFRFGVDDTDDSLRLALGSALGTNDSFIMTANGERTLPLQSAFLAYLSSSDNNVTGNGTTYTLGSSALTEVFDQNGDFNTNGTFTAPVTGKYLLTMTVRLIGMSSAANDTVSSIVTSNRTYQGAIYSPSGVDATGVSGFYFSALVDMDAADTSTFTIMVDGEASDIADVNGSSTLVTKVGGYLVC